MNRHCDIKEINIRISINIINGSKRQIKHKFTPTNEKLYHTYMSIMIDSSVWHTLVKNNKFNKNIHYKI